MKTTSLIKTLWLSTAAIIAAAQPPQPGSNLGGPTPAGPLPRSQPPAGGPPPANPPPGGTGQPTHPGTPPPKPRPGNPPTPPALELPVDLPSFDGTGHAEAQPQRGAAGQSYRRLVPAAYADSVGAPAGADRPNPRTISNAVIARPADARPNRLGLSDLFWNWGQFIDHDLDETPTAVPAEPLPIAIPAGDPQFDPDATGTATLGLNRSAWSLADGVRQQQNAITHYLDGSMVYGSSLERANALRALDGSGRLKTSPSEHGDLLPLNTESIANVPPGPGFFVAGDVRANEQPGLLALHTLFVREHNHWADRYRGQHPQATDEESFQFARRIVSAELQAITYREFLPLLLGPRALPPYRGHQPGVDATVSNEFATAAYRFGHSTVSARVLRLGPDWREAAEGHLSLREAFFNPALVADHGIDSLLRGMAGQPCEELDEWIVDDLRNFLFGAPGAGGLDLAALNIQRGRDHGLPSFNAVRQALGLKPALRFRDVHPNPAVIAELSSAYGSPEDMDLWVAGLAERDRPGSMLGETLHRIVADQFRRSRDGDRFWYQSHLPPELVRLVEEQSLARIIQRNTRIGAELPRNPWRAKKPQP